MTQQEREWLTFVKNKNIERYAYQDGPLVIIFSWMKDKGFQTASACLYDPDKTKERRNFWRDLFPIENRDLDDPTGDENITKVQTKLLDDVYARLEEIKGIINITTKP